MSIQFRPIIPAEQDQALDLWDRTFQPGEGYFRRYYHDDPWYQEGDSLGAWEGGRLVSAVHVCRRPVEWAGRTVWCGAIANVATEPEYRRQGLSRDLLRQALDRMNSEGMHFSMLFTGRFGHYAALGWEQVETPVVRIRLSPEPQLSEVPLSQQSGVDSLAELYWRSPPRPLLLHRPDRYYRGWVGWHWRHHGVTLLGEPDLGFLALRAQGEEPGAAEVVEWHPMDAEAERVLLQEAGRRASAAGKAVLKLASVPYYEGLAALSALGEPEARVAGPMMLRNLALTPDEYAEICRLYSSGDATWWPSDAF